MTATIKTCLIATVKDEGPWLLEWIAHNQAIGFDVIAVASNDCADGTDAMLDRLAELGHVIHVPNPAPYKRSIQSMAYARLRECEPVAGADWIIALDADEFLNIHHGAGTVHELIGLQEDDCDGIIISWRVFGDAGHLRWQDTPICETFQRANDSPESRTQTKALFRNSKLFTSFEAHGPWRPAESLSRRRGKRLKLRTPDGIVVNQQFFFQNPPTSDGTKPKNNWSIGKRKRNWTTAQINHYIVKTRDVYALKQLRGRGWSRKPGRPNTRHTAAFFERMNCNQVEDRSIERTAEARTHAHAKLMRDPVLADLHARACAHLRQLLSERSAQND